MAASQDPLRRYIDAAMALGQLTQARAEAFVRDLVQEGEGRAAEAQGLVAELLERTRRDLEGLRRLVQREIMAQLEVLDLATKGDLAALEARLAAAVPRPAPEAAPTPRADAGEEPATDATSAREAPAKRGTARKAAAKKAAAKKAAPAKRAAAKAAPAKRAAKKAGATSGATRPRASGRRG